MKAKEYFDKYEASFFPDGKIPNEVILNKVCFDLFLELSKEVILISKLRNTSTDKAFTATIKEVNQKWNKLSSLFFKKYKWSPLKEDGFKRWWDKELVR